MNASGRLLLRPKMLILGAVFVSLAGILVFAASREAPRTSPSTTTQPSARPPRAALTPEEERYIRELWPIHGDVQRSTVQMSLGQIFYKTQDLGRAELGTRVERALATYRAADARLRALEPPGSLRSEHEEYLSAVRSFEESAVELLKMFKDGRDDHMLAAYPKSQQGSDKIREVGGKFWPNEFPAN
jgi:hypothetical protein